MTIRDRTVELARIAGGDASAKIESGVVVDGDIQLEVEGGVLRIHLGTGEGFLYCLVRENLEITHLEILEIKLALVGVELLGYVAELGRINA